MNTKMASFILTLVLTAIACELPSQILISQPGQAPDGRVPQLNPTSTATVEPSPTYTYTATATAVPPTKTAIPTSTSTPRVASLEIVATGNVIIREGPCYQTPIANAKPGMEFLVTGWYRSPQGEEWLRIEFRDTNNKTREGWVRADLVEVTNSELLERVFANCPPTVTPTIEETPSILDSYIRLYRHSGFSGDYLDIWLMDCGIVNFDSNSHFHDSISSFEIFAPENVEVVLAQHQFYDDQFPGITGRARGNNRLLRVDVAELKKRGLQNEISSVIWLVDGHMDPTVCEW